MNLYKGEILYAATHDDSWDFEAEDDNEARAIVDERAQSTGYYVIQKKLYLIGKRIA